jgi:hypothetical protein
MFRAVNANNFLMFFVTKAIVLVIGKPFQPRLVVMGREGAYPRVGT